MLLFIQLSSSNVSARGFNFQFRHGGGLARAAHWMCIRRPLATGVTESSGQFSRIFLNLSSRHPPTRARTLRAPTIQQPASLPKATHLPPKFADLGSSSPSLFQHAANKVPS